MNIKIKNTYNYLKQIQCFVYLSFQCFVKQRKKINELYVKLPLHILTYEA